MQLIQNIYVQKYQQLRLTSYRFTINKVDKITKNKVDKITKKKTQANLLQVHP